MIKMKSERISVAAYLGSVLPNNTAKSTAIQQPPTNTARHANEKNLQNFGRMPIRAAYANRPPPAASPRNASRRSTEWPVDLPSTIDKAAMITQIAPVAIPP